LLFLVASFFLLHYALFSWIYQFFYKF
jgi:hypothetical protein